MKKQVKLLIFIFLSCCIAGGLFASQFADKTETFPRYSEIEPNVKFWTDIYSKYSLSQGVIHDTINLEIVYAVIELLPRSKKGSRRINRKRIKKEKLKYKKLIERFITEKPLTETEKNKIELLFGKKPEISRLLIAKNNIRFQRGQKDRFRDGLLRSREYIEEIQSIFRQNDLPEDLAFLPHVESSFNYSAYSKFGAAGIWQFTYSTGRRFMKVNYTVDERLDPIRATHGAAKLLKSNYQRLGSWALALTAYNHGAKAMARAKKQMGNYPTIFKEYNGRRFKFASRNFYPEFLAAREVAKNSTRYFGKIEQKKPTPTKEFIVKDFIALATLSKHLDTDLITIKKHNRALRKPVFQGQKYVPKGYRLRLPDKPGIEEMVLNIPETDYFSKQKRSLFYSVRRGDVASVIARRHGIKLKELIWANNLNYRARIYAGQNLRIPTQKDIVTLAAKFKEKPKKEKVSNQQKVEINETEKVSLPVSETQNFQTDKAISDINPAVVTGNIRIKRVFKSKGRLFGVIQVETVETLGHYANWLKVSTQTIRTLNGLNFRKNINLDDQIIVPLNQVSQDQFEEKRYEFHKEFEEDFFSAYTVETVSIYKINKGDNIWMLCKEKFELPVWLIKKYNLSINLNRLKLDQKILVPIIVEKEDIES